MKKIFICFFSFVLLITTAVPAFAASNSDEILNSLRSGVVVNGKTVAIPTSYINQAENYFASHHITDEQASYILGQVNAAKSSIQAAGVTDLSKMDASTKKKIISDVQATANNIDLKLTIGADKNIKIADSNGVIAFSDGNPIKTTGLQINWVACFLPFGFVLLGTAAGCSYLIYKNKRAEHED